MYLNSRSTPNRHITHPYRTPYTQPPLLIIINEGLLDLYTGDDLPSGVGGGFAFKSYNPVHYAVSEMYELWPRTWGFKIQRSKAFRPSFSASLSLLIWVFSNFAKPEWAQREYPPAMTRNFRPLSTPLLPPSLWDWCTDTESGVACIILYYPQGSWTALTTVWSYRCGSPVRLVIG